MDKNFNLENAKSIIAEASGVPVNTTFGSITKPIDLLLEVIDMSADLIALIREETELKSITAPTSTFMRNWRTAPTRWQRVCRRFSTRPPTA